MKGRVDSSSVGHVVSLSMFDAAYPVQNLKLLHHGVMSTTRVHTQHYEVGEFCAWRIDKRKLCWQHGVAVMHPDIRALLITVRFDVHLRVVQVQCNRHAARVRVPVRTTSARFAQGSSEVADRRHALGYLLICAIDTHFGPI